MDVLPAFQAISDPTRRAILLQLIDGPRAAGGFVPPRPISQPALSKHLRILRESGLVRAERDGRRQVYHLQPGALRTVADWIAHFEHFWDDRLDALGDTLDAMAASEASLGRDDG